MESPSQTPPPPPGPDKNGRDATAEVESPPRSETRHESLDNPEKDVNWQFIGVVVAVFFGWLNYKNSHEVAEGVAKGVMEGLKEFTEIPDKAAETAARVQRDPTAPLVDRARAAAVLLQQQGKIEEAIEKWRAIAIVAGEEDRQLQARAWFSIGYLRGEGKGVDLEAARYAYTKALQLNPAYANAYNNRGYVLNELGQHEDALADFNRAIELDPTYTNAYNNRGYTNVKLGRINKAREDYQKVLGLAQAAGDETMVAELKNFLCRLDNS